MGFFARKAILLALAERIKKQKNECMYILEPLFHKKERAPFFNEFVILHSFLCIKVIILYSFFDQI